MIVVREKIGALLIIALLIIGLFALQTERVTGWLSPRVFPGYN